LTEAADKAASDEGTFIIEVDRRIKLFKPLVKIINAMISASLNEMVEPVECLDQNPNLEASHLRRRHGPRLTQLLSSRSSMV